MPQSADRVLDHAPLFREPEYTELLARKRENFECPASTTDVEAQNEYSKGWEYREKNLAREALVINPAKACQPLGAVFAAAGFEGTMSFVHGSQGCVAYYRSHLSRHFKEPASAVSSSMTEDAAVFGGLNNMVDGLANAYSLYDPKMIAVSTTCMAEVIGDDLHAFIETSKQKGSVPQEFDVPFAHTPAFVGSHVDGYDNMVKGVLEHFWNGKERKPTGKINIIPGFDGFCVGNNRELKRILDLMGVEYTIAAGCVRSVRHAVRRRVPHVLRRHHARGYRRRAQRQGHRLDADLLHAPRRSTTRRSKGTKPRASTIRSASARPTRCC